MKKAALLNIIILFAMSCVLSCKPWSQDSKLQDEIKTESVVNTDTCDIDSTGYRPLLGYFDYDSVDLLEVYFEKYAGGTMKDGAIVKTVSLGPNTGEAQFTIKNWAGSLVYKKKKHLLLDNHKDSLLVLKAMDLDGDGEKEIIAHDGEAAFIYQMKKNQPRFCGQIPSNWNFWVTDDYTIVSRIGSQGNATLSKLTGGKLTSPEDIIIDKLMMESDDLKNLRYEFAERTDSTVHPLLEAPHFSIAQKGMAVLREELDGDGNVEQAVFYFSRWALDASDRIALICDNNHIDLFERIIQEKDSTGLSLSDYEFKVKSPIQLTAHDVDDDGYKEVIVTVGDQSANSSYVFGLNDDHKSVSLIKHLKLKEELPTLDLLYP